MAEIHSNIEAIKSIIKSIIRQSKNANIDSRIEQAQAVQKKGDVLPTVRMIAYFNAVLFLFRSYIAICQTVSLKKSFNLTLFHVVECLRLEHILP